MAGKWEDSTPYECRNWTSSNGSISKSIKMDQECLYSISLDDLDLIRRIMGNDNEDNVADSKVKSLIKK